MKQARTYLAGVLSLGLIASAAQADLASVAAAIGADLNPGVAPTGIFGTVIGGNESSGLQLTPFETAISGYDFMLPSAMGAAAGNLRDFHWVHETSAVGPGGGTIWSFGGLASTEFILDPSVDHVPIPEEGLETTLWGSNDGGATWILGTLTRIYADGWDPVSIEDEPSSLWEFSERVSLISATAGFAQGTYVFDSFDTEIDAVSLIPAPGAFVLGALGLGMVGWVRRKFA